MSAAADQPEGLWTGGRLTIVRHAPQPGSDGASLIEAWMSPGQGPNAFVHERADSLYHLLEGAMTFLVDGVLTELGAGDSIFAARGVEHTYRVDGESVARVLMISASGSAWVDYFRAIGQPATALTLPPADFVPLPMDTIHRAADANGLRFVGSRLPGASRTGAAGADEDH